jgi:type VI secretion system protein ImpC
MPREVIQSSLARLRAPRVHLRYEVEVGGAIEARELPFVVGILASVSGQPREAPMRLKDRRFVNIDRDNFDEVLARVAPRLVFAVPDLMTGASDPIAIELTFASVGDFEADAVAKRVPALRARLEERGRVAGGREDPERSDRLRRLDTVLSAQLSAILHAEPFRRLEATWRGLHYLVTETETSSALKLRLLDVDKNTLLKDFSRAAEFEQTTLFKLIYEEEYGTFGGEPVGLLLGAFEFDAHPQDIELLEGVSHVAAAAHAPFIAGASPGLFNLQRFADLSQPRDLASIFATIEYARWHSFRESEDARYVGLTVPRILLRRPYVAGWARPFAFDERVDTHDDLLWGNAAFALAVCITSAFAKYGWCAAIRGVEGGGLVESLPTVVSPGVDDGGAAKAVSDVLITDRREKELSDLGVIPLTAMRGRDYAAFFSMATCFKPRTYTSEAATANSRLSAQLQYVLTTSRFAHYLRCITRDKFASFMSRPQCEEVLNGWLAQYVATDDGTSSAQKAKHPLAEARVDVVEIPGRPNAFRAIVFLRPHFQLDELSVSMRLVVDLPTSAP